MIKGVKLSKDHWRLMASLVFNFAAKLPGVVAVFVILPMISKSLGSASYGELLSALALGSVFTLPFGGINAVGRRLLASAYGGGDKKEQADIFATTLSFMTVVALAALLIMVGISARSWSSPVFLLAAALPMIAGFANTFDNLRASYNEHYVTAALQLFFQIVIYAAVYLAGLPQGGVTISGLALQAPYILASLGTVVALIWVRPYLLKGQIRGLRKMVAPALGVMLADGALAVLLNLSVYWLKVAGDADMAGWVGTFVRLFQSFMSPVLLIMFPVTTYISGRWKGMKPRRRLLLHKLFILAGLGYGVVVGVGMAFGGPLYIYHMFKLNAQGDAVDVLALSLFMGAVIAQKAYTLLLYAVSEARFVSYGTALVSVAGIATALVASLFLPPIRVIDALFIFMGVCLPVLLIVGGYRHRKVDMMDVVEAAN